MEERWPRATFELEHLVDDMVDLWLLVACDFVVGTAFSSYSHLAILLNGSDRCKALNRPLATVRDPVSRLWREYARWPPGRS
jgi:hypothetical protein